MTMREHFTDDEWRLVRHVPFDAFLLVALADKQLEDSEVRAFVETIQRAPQLKDQLHREIALDWAVGGPDSIAEEMRFQSRESAADMRTRIERTKAAMRKHLTQEQYQSFLLSVTLSGLAVAAASVKRTGIFGKKEAISKEEAHAVAAFAGTWGLDPKVFGKELAGVK